MGRVVSFLSILAVLAVMFVLFSCSLSPTLTKVPDTTPPSVTITFPRNDQVIYDNRITVSGTASDVGSGVKEVWLSVNGGAYGRVNGTTSWSTNITVNYGNNTIRVYAVDNLGNVSDTNTVSVFRDYVVFVSTVGSDANSGGISDPFRSINVAMNYISTNITNLGITVKVRVSSGLYTNGSGLSSSNSGFVIDRPNIVISGGWDSGFSSVEGKSELDGNNSLYHVVMITNVTNVKLENLVIRGGNANGSDPDDRGGGIYVSNVSYLVIKSSVVISNNSATNGGGLLLYDSQNTTISGSVYNNIALHGGGLYLYNSTNTTISGSVDGNGATYGGGLYLYNSTNTTISGSVDGNSATYGGGLYLNNSPNTTISSSVNFNIARWGGGLYLEYSPNTTISGRVYNNICVYIGGGVYLYGSPNTTISGRVYNNIANWAGGLYLLYSPNTTISGSVDGNKASQYGGGLVLYNSDYFTNAGWITNNRAYYSTGGGVYRIGSYDNSYFGNVSGNYPDDIAP